MGSTQPAVPAMYCPQKLAGIQSSYVMQNQTLHLLGPKILLYRCGFSAIP
jgi:hypothetical protein